MKITADIKAKAAELAEKHGFDELFVNAKGEFFTSKSNAANSVDGNKEKYAQVHLGVAGSGERTTTDLDKAADVIAQIEAAEDKEGVEAILEAESEGKNRKTVIEAALKKVKAFEAASAEKTAADAKKLNDSLKQASETTKTDK